MSRLIFISYRRETGYELAHLVNAELRSRGVRTFIDVSESDPGQFWPQIRAAIHSCSAFVLICTNGSFETRQGDDWVLREVGEATTLGRPIIPVFSQDFKRPAVLLPLLAQATEYNGVSMDTQFHVAAFDHLSQLVGGRKRSEQRRRVAVLAGRGRGRINTHRRPLDVPAQRRGPPLLRAQRIRRDGVHGRREQRGARAGRAL